MFVQQLAHSNESIDLDVPGSRAGLLFVHFSAASLESLVDRRMLFGPGKDILQGLTVPFFVYTGLLTYYGVGYSDQF